MNVFKLYRVSSYGNLKPDLRIFDRTYPDYFSNKVFTTKENLLSYYTPLLDSTTLPYKFIEESEGTNDEFGYTHYYDGCHNEFRRYVVVKETLI